jgi:hypothetical protein
MPIPAGLPATAGCAAAIDALAKLTAAVITAPVTTLETNAVRLVREQHINVLRECPITQETVTSNAFESSPYFGVLLRR